MVDVPPLRAAAAGGLSQHFLYFGAALNRDGLQPRLAQPVMAAVLEFIAAKGHVLNDAMLVQNKGNVSGGGNQRRCCLRVQAREKQLGAVKLPNGIFVGCLQL